MLGLASNEGLGHAGDEARRNAMGHYAGDMRPEWFEKEPPKREPDANQFRVGDVWETTRGHLYRVIEVRRGGQAILRAGATGERGRIVRKQWDGTGWWARVSCVA